jgi:DNA topoisomerase VI subunit A
MFRLRRRKPRVLLALPQMLVRDPHFKSAVNKIEIVQRRAARYVTNRQRNTSSVSDMLQHLEWCSLEDRRRDARLVMMYKISHDKVAVSKSETFRCSGCDAGSQESYWLYHRCC